MPALKLQQLQYQLKKNFLPRLRGRVFPLLFGGSPCGEAMSNGYRTCIHPRDTGIWGWSQLSVHCGESLRGGGEGSKGGGGGYTYTYVRVGGHARTHTHIHTKKYSPRATEWRCGGACGKGVANFGEGWPHLRRLRHNALQSLRVPYHPPNLGTQAPPLWPVCIPRQDGSPPAPDMCSVARMAYSPSSCPFCLYAFNRQSSNLRQAAQPHAMTAPDRATRARSAGASRFWGRRGRAGRTPGAPG